MKFCGGIENNIKNKCDTLIAGIKRMYLINAQDFVAVDDTTIYLTIGSKAYEIDAAKNSASLVQNVVNNNDNMFVESTLTFTVNRGAANLREQELELNKGRYKLLIEYYDNTWLFVDEYENFFFKLVNSSKTTGVNENDLIGITFTFVLRGHSYGIHYDKIPDVITDTSTDPIWVQVDEYCENI